MPHQPWRQTAIVCGFLSRTSTIDTARSLRMPFKGPRRYPDRGGTPGAQTRFQGETRRTGCVFPVELRLRPSPWRGIVLREGLNHLHAWIEKTYS